MANITLLMGPNEYALRCERRRWVQAFKERQGEDSLFTADARQVNWKDLHNECQMAPFLAEKRLLVVDGVPSRGSKEDVRAVENLLHPSALLLFVLQTEAGKKPKLTVTAKELMEIADVKQFPLLASGQLQQWIDEQSVQDGGDGITPEAKQLLLRMVGEDQLLLANEIAKLRLYAHGRIIAADDVELLAAGSTDRDVWKLMDYLGEGDVNGALQYAYGLLDRGYSPQALWNTFVWMITSLTNIVALVEAGQTNPWKIAGTVRANPFGVKAILPFARSVSRERLQSIVRTALDADTGLKTGAYKTSSDASDELLALIDRSILSFAR